MAVSRIVSIHQPNFFPWLGYFQKIARADRFVLLDNVQFPKKGGTWCNRVQLLIGGQPKFVTLPVVRNYHGVRMIAEIEIDDRSAWRRKLLESIRQSYGKAPQFEAVFPLLRNLVETPTVSLADFNATAIRALVEVLGLGADKLVLGSSLAVAGKATDLLIATVKALDGDAYLCGGGADAYQEDEKFAEAGIELIFQNFEHPNYAQINAGAFVPGLSIIDCLMNRGLDRTRALLVEK